MKKVLETKLSFGAEGAEKLVELYRTHVGNYPKFFKMDPLCRLGFVASEMLLNQENPRKFDCEDRAIVLFNRSASLADDSAYQKTIRDPEDYYPSPAVFVYTLPNIVTGEIAIRNKYYGESSFYVMEERDDELMMRTAALAFRDPAITSVLAGWVECPDPEHYEADLFILEK